MIPKSIYLEYPTNFQPEGDPNAFLPRVVHTRPSATKKVSYKPTAVDTATVMLRSEYDVLNDIVLEMHVVGNVGFVKRVYFVESV